MAVRLACCICLFAAGLAAGCGAKKTAKPQWETVTVNGHTLRVTRLGSITLSRAQWARLHAGTYSARGSTPR
jgi:hypothetical protein